MEENNFYPEKPELIEKVSEKNSKKTIFSLLLFVITFSLIGTNDYSFIFFLVSVIFIHELGHFLFMKKFRYTNVKMLFIPLMGAFVEGKKEEYHQKESLIVLLAGPIPGIVLGLFLLYFGVEWKIDWLNDFAFLFLFLNLLNLLPLDPLDGGQILKLLINKSTELFQLIFSFISSLIMIGIGWYFELWLLVIFGFIMGLRVRKIQKNYLIHKELNKEKINYNTNYKLLTNLDFAKIKEVVLDFTPALRKYMSQIDDETLNPIIADQVNNVLETPLKKNATILFKIIVLIIWFSAFISPFILINHLGLFKF